MSRRLALVLGTAFFLAGYSHAQLGRMEECLPIPSYGSELRSFRVNVPKPVTPKVQASNFTIESSKIPGPAIKKLKAEILGKRFEADSDWKTEIGEYVRFTFQNYGYFRAEVKVSEVNKGFIQESPIMVRRAQIIASVQEGALYRLEEIQFNGQSAFSSEQLRPLFPLSSGDIFNTSKIRDGLAALRNAYESKGFLFLTTVPDTTVDEEKKTVLVDVNVDEGGVYSVGSVKVLGLPEDIVKRTLEKTALTPGEVYYPKKIDELFIEFRKYLPKNAIPSKDAEYAQVDHINHTINLTLDFRKCPGD